MADTLTETKLRPANPCHAMSLAANSLCQGQHTTKAPLCLAAHCNSLKTAQSCLFLRRRNVQLFPATVSPFWSSGACSWTVGPARPIWAGQGRVFRSPWRTVQWHVVRPPLAGPARLLPRDSHPSICPGGGEMQHSDPIFMSWVARCRQVASNRADDWRRAGRVRTTFRPMCG